MMDRRNVFGNGNHIPDLGKRQQATVQVSLAVIAARLPKQDEPFEGRVLDGENLRELVKMAVREELASFAEMLAEQLRTTIAEVPQREE